jgi:uncharacterized membrane protein (UPF0127 family)
MIFPLAACAAADGKPQPKLEALPLKITARDGRSVTVLAELARTDAERKAGLMFREKLADGEGMLFIWERDIVLSFWMKNTIIPLSIAYIDRAGVIAEIHDMKIGQLNPVQSMRSLRYALEVPRGYFERAGITTGDTIEIEGISR